MKEKMVHQYRCDFCSKKKYSKPHMIQHEKCCTMNPDRHCRMCMLIGEEQQLVENLLIIFPKDLLKCYKEIQDNCAYIGLAESNKLTEMFKPHLDKLYQAVHTCPACMLAVIRQSGLRGFDIGFDYKKEIEAFWEDYNKRQREKEEREMYNEICH